MPKVIKIRRKALSGEEKKGKSELKHAVKEHIHDLVKEGKISKKVDKLIKKGKLKIALPTTTEIKVNDKAYKELLYVFKAYKIPFKRVQKGIEIDTTKKL